MIEAERRFLVHGRPWEDGTIAAAQASASKDRARIIGIEKIVQAYLSTALDHTVRVRLVRSCSELEAVREAFLTVKGRKVAGRGIELEYGIPYEDGEQMVRMANDAYLISKTRYTVQAPGCEMPWVIDEFHGRHAGLVLAELEFKGEDMTIAAPPAWLGAEVTEDHRFSNLQLALAGCPPGDEGAGH